MKKLILALLLSTGGLSHAQVKVPREVVCAPTEWILKALDRDYKEKPVWMGKGDGPTSYMLLVNLETKTWTMVHIAVEVSCVIGSGHGLLPVNELGRLKI